MNTRQQNRNQQSNQKHRFMEVNRLTAENPASSVLVAFGIGLGVGVALGSILAGPLTHSPTFTERTELAAEKLGRQIMDAIAGVLPESLAKHVS